MGTTVPAVHRNRAPTALPRAAISTILTAPRSAPRRAVSSDIIQRRARHVDRDRPDTLQPRIVLQPTMRSVPIGPHAGARPDIGPRTRESTAPIATLDLAPPTGRCRIAAQRVPVRDDTPRRPTIGVKPVIAKR